MSSRGFRIIFNGEPHGPEEEWPRVSSSAERRKLQNRLNQRAFRRRKAVERGDRKARDLASRSCNKLHKIAPRPTIENGQLAMEEVGMENSTGMDLRRAEEATHCQPTIHRAIDPLSFMCPALLDRRKRRVMHYATSVLWPGFGQTVIIPSTSSWVDVFWRLCLTNDLLLNSFLWTAALDLRLCHPEQSDDQVLLGCHTRCLQQLRDRLKQADFGDDVIHVVAAFAICGDFSELSEPDLSNCDRNYASSFNSPIKQVGMLHNVSRYTWCDRHYEVLRLLVQNRGGLHTLKLPGIAETVQTIELFQATTHISTPDLGLSKTYQYVLDHIAAKIRPPREEVEPFLVAINEYDSDICEVLLDVRMFCKIVTQAEIQHQGCLPSNQLLTYRNLIQRRLLLLPRRTGLDSTLYELCRLAALIFSYGVVYPLRGGQQLEILVQTLIRTFQQHECLPGEAVFLLWASMMGALGAVKRSQVDFFVHQLACISQVLSLETWCEAVEVFEKFLWLDKACDVGGNAIWERLAGRARKEGRISCTLVSI